MTKGRWRSFTLLLILLISSETLAAIGRTEGSFAVSATGEATYTIPIFTPPGSGGLTPTLAFVYGHRAGPGPLGVGWGLSGLSAITRCPKTWDQDGSPRDVKLDAADRFCLDGNQLRLVSGTYGQSGSEYRTELETFSRITHYGITGLNHFIVERKDGLIYEYGNTHDSRIEAVGLAAARTWALSKIRDRAGNAILFNYTEDTVNGNYRISSIQYTSNPGQGLSPAYVVNFVYQLLPTGEVASRYFAGSIVRRVARLDYVDITHNSNLVRRYDLGYESGLSSTNASRLGYIQECAGASPDCFSATTFSYQNGAIAFNGEVSTGISIAGSTNILSIDINGDRRTDVVYSSSATSGTGAWMYALANSSGGFNAPVNSGITNTNFSQAIPIDYNADGLEDFLVPYSGGTWWVVQGSTSGLLSPVNTGAPAAGAGGNARAMDVNGDGLEDLVWADLVGGGNDSIQYRLRVWGGAFQSSASYWLPPVGLGVFIMGPVFRTPPFASRHREADFNGDGLDDFVVRIRILDPEVNPTPVDYGQILLGGGSGGFTIDSIPVSTNVYSLDINGDGYTDFAYALGGVWRYRLSKGTSLESLQTGPSTTDYLTESTVVIDWDGDGRDDLLVRHIPTNRWHVIRSTGEVLGSPTTTGLFSTSTTNFVGDPNGDGLLDVLYLNTSTLAYRLHSGVEPDLLASATDGYGNAVNFSYVPLTQSNYTKHADATYPEQDYQGPRYVVSQATASNGIGGTYTLSYWYYGARVHLRGRGFEGFQTVRVHDSRNGLYAYNYFNRTFPLMGTAYRADLYQPNGTTLISRTEHTWASYGYGTGHQTRQFPYVSSSTVRTYELDGAFNGVLLSTAVTSNSVDSSTGTLYDSTIVVTEGSSANGVNAGQQHTQRTYHSALFTDTTSWCIGRPSTTQQINSHTMYGGSTLTRRQDLDWNGSFCRPEQVTLEYGDPQWQVTTDLGYDGFGNVNSQAVTGIGMAQRATSIYWGADGQFPVLVTNALSQATLIGWSSTAGVRTSQTDPNGIYTSWQYDDFGRRTRENRPDGTATTWSYNACSTSGCVSSSNLMVVVATDLSSSGTFVRDQWTYLDKFDRPLVARALTLFGAYSRVDREYDALGRVSRDSAPCWWSASCTYWTTYSYDLLNRLTAASRPIDVPNPTLQTSNVYYEGLTARTVDPEGKQTTKIANAIGQVARSMDHDGHYQTFDYDVFGNPVRVTDSAGNTLQSSTYGITGALLTRTDMDRGMWTYASNALGEVEHIRDAKTTAPAWTTNMVYDLLGRMTSRQDVAEAVTSIFTFGNSAAAKNIGRLASLSGGGYAESFTYDSIGRLQNTTITSDASYQIDYGYNTLGLLGTLTYPTSTSGYRLKLQYDYQNGELLRVKDFNAPSSVFWLANATDPRGNLIDETLGNGLRTIRGYDLVTGGLDYIQSDSSGGTSIQNLGYSWDKVGNLTQRQDLRQSLTEAFYYDNLYRLDYSTLNGTTNRDFTYNALGNITFNSDVGTYTYHTTKRHAVATAGAYTFGYNNNGNVTSDGTGGTVSWYSYNLPNVISGVGSSGTGTSQMWYGPERNRWKHVATSGGVTETTLYVGGILEKVTVAGVTSWKHFINGGSGPVGLYTRRDNGTQSTSYFTTDHLGSVDSITDASGVVQVRLSYHAFGKRRKEAGWSGSPSTAEYLALSNTSWRGFTFHEMLDSVGMIHMNGRVYSPTLGRFLSPDPFVPDPLNTQSFNRYSYVQNSPLSATDPSGFEDRVVLPGREGLDPAVFQERQRDITQKNHHFLLFLAATGFGGGRFGGFIGVTGPINLFRPAPSWYYDGCGARGDCVSTAEMRPVVTAPTLEQIGTQGPLYGQAPAPSTVDRMLATPSAQRVNAYLDAAANGDWGDVFRAGLGIIKGEWRDAYATPEGALLTTMSVVPVVGIKAAAARGVLAAPRQIAASWGASVYRHGGLMTSIEHVMYRHGFNSGFSGVSRFAQGTRIRDISSYVDSALRYGRVTPTYAGAFMVEYNVGRVIGTDVAGNAASNIRIYIRDGIIQTAFPF